MPITRTHRDTVPEHCTWLLQFIICKPEKLKEFEEKLLIFFEMLKPVAEKDGEILKVWLEHHDYYSENIDELLKLVDEQQITQLISSTPWGTK